jgi:hypothetical protein
MQQRKDKGPKQSPDEREKHDLDAALARWRKIERVVKGRYLHGAEFQTAADAWKELCSVISRVKGEEIQIPDAPKPAIIPEITPAALAQTALALSVEKTSESVGKKFEDARELLIQAASYLHYCAARPMTDWAELTGISFAEIIASNEKGNSDDKKLLPGITTEEGLINLIRRYFAERHLNLTPKEQKAVEKATGHRLSRIENQAGEGFIKGRYLPRQVLADIRQWRVSRRRQNSIKGMQGQKSAR